ncbi:MAG: transglutaminase domain-containing protein [Planctomycetota bacterium]|jgi:hypothetical protein
MSDIHRNPVPDAVPATTGVAVQWLTCGLGLLSALLLEVAASVGTPDVANIAGSMVVQGLLVLAAFVFFRRRASRGLPAPLSLVPILCGVALLPFAVELVARHMYHRGWTLELTLLSLLRNLVLGLCAASVWPRFQRLGASLSVLLAIFAASFGHDRALVFLLGLYSIAGVWWLTGSYWDSLRGHITAESAQSLPRRWFLLLPGLVVVLALMMSSAGRGAVTTALRGFMPTSGGTQWQDDFASGGVNDGQALVAAENEASSFGPVETDLFIDSEQPSLYDAFDEQYDEPVRKQKSERAISLPSDLLKDTHQQMAQAKKAHREFSTVRQQIHQHRRQQDVDTDALFFVSGRTPLHLRLEEYDLFDGQDWYPASEPGMRSALPVEMRDGQPWMQLDTNTTDAELYSGTELHSLKTVALEGNHLPLPLHATELMIDRVDRPDMFSWARDSILRLQRETIPSLMVIHTRSRVGAPEPVAALDSRFFLKRSQEAAQITNPTDFATRQVEKLAAQWTEGLPRGWSQINAIVTKLRSEYVHDRDHQQGVDSVNPTAQFVLRDRRGPDFLFASAAAVMLRSLEYPTRLVSGFYASPENYDATTGHTPVGSEDVHFWCEVYLGAQTWLPVEPTPGYEILKPRVSLIQRLAKQLRIAVAWCEQRWPMLVSTIVLLLAGWKIGLWRILRDHLFDAFWLLIWRLSVRRDHDPRQYIRATRQLVQRRSRLARCERSPGESDRSFLARIMETADGVDGQLIDSWLRLADWHRFAPPDMSLSFADPGLDQVLPHCDAQTAGAVQRRTAVEQCCESIINTLSVAAFRAATSVDGKSSLAPARLAGSTVPLLHTHRHQSVRNVTSTG